MQITERDGQDNATREYILGLIVDVATERLKRSDDFSTEELKQYYVNLLKNARISVSANINDVKKDPGTPWTAGNGTIVAHRGAFEIRFQDKNGAWVFESENKFLNRAAGELLHEVRHLTKVNFDMGTPQMRIRARMDPRAHATAPFEIDANRFENIVMGRKKGVINDK